MHSAAEHFFHLPARDAHVRVWCEGPLLKMHVAGTPVTTRRLPSLDAARLAVIEKCDALRAAGAASSNSAEWQRAHDASAPQPLTIADARWRVVGHDPEGGFAQIRIQCEQLGEMELPEPKVLLRDARASRCQSLSILGWRAPGAVANDYTAWTTALAGDRRPALRHLALDSLASSDVARSDRAGSLGAIAAAAPALGTIEGCFTPSDVDAFAAPALRKLTINAEWSSPAHARALLESDLPELTTLRLHPGLAPAARIEGTDVLRWLERLATPLANLELYRVAYVPGLFEALAACASRVALSRVTLHTDIDPTSAAAELGAVRSALEPIDVCVCAMVRDELENTRGRQWLQSWSRLSPTYA